MNSLSLHDNSIFCNKPPGSRSDNRPEKPDAGSRLTPLMVTILRWQIMWVGRDAMQAGGK
ncbi:hypothetical protein CRN75_09345 [Yersinia frederiksenii]|nr:hypothetical protein CRN75_09345 [Yersinia frederiksenii]